MLQIICILDKYDVKYNDVYQQLFSAAFEKVIDSRKLIFLCNENMEIKEISSKLCKR